jgi:multidrug efflux system outer membrane protein
MLKNQSLLAVLLLAGCAVGPDYKRPELDLPNQWQESLADIGIISDKNWWRSFNDPNLDKLVERALNSNLDIKVATARVDQFYNLYGVTRSQLFPDVSAKVAYTKGEGSQSTIPASPDNAIERFEAAGLLSWELDIWGQLRREVEGAKADLRAQEEIRRGVIVSVISALVTSYVELAELDQRLIIARETLLTRSGALDIARMRLDSGLISELEAKQAEAEMISVQVVIPLLEAAVVQRENLISVLLGSNPQKVERGLPLGALMENIVIPPGLPSELLENRPDIKQAEQELISANAAVGVAKGEYLPRLRLTGFYGFASSELSDWLKSPAEQWAYGGDVLAPVLNFGRISGQVGAAEARAEVARNRYKKSVLNALQEVEDSLVAIRKYREQVGLLNQQADVAAQYFALSDAKYNEGESDYLDVLDAQRLTFSVANDRAKSEGEFLRSYIRLYRSLGGGWIEEAEGLVTPQLLSN